MWGKNSTAGQATENNITRRMRVVCWISQATDTHLQCVIIIALPQQQWLHERVSILGSYVHCLPCFNVGPLELLGRASASHKALKRRRRADRQSGTPRLTFEPAVTVFEI